MEACPLCGAVLAEEHNDIRGRWICRECGLYERIETDGGYEPKKPP